MTQNEMPNKIWAYLKKEWGNHGCWQPAPTAPNHPCTQYHNTDYLRERLEGERKPYNTIHNNYIYNAAIDMMMEILDE